MPNNIKYIDPMEFDNREVDLQDTPSTPPGLINPMEFDVKTKSFEEKIYIILYRLNHEDDVEEAYSRIFSVCIGRTETFQDIKNKLTSGIPVDVHRSKIITETKQTESSSGDKKYYLMAYEDAVSVYDFCKHVESYYSDDEFDIEEYNLTDIPEPDEELREHKGFLTPEQLEYKKMLEASIKRDKFIVSMRHELGFDKTDNNV